MLSADYVPRRRPPPLSCAPCQVYSRVMFSLRRKVVVPRSPVWFQEDPKQTEPHFRKSTKVGAERSECAAGQRRVDFYPPASSCAVYTQVSCAVSPPPPGNYGAGSVDADRRALRVWPR